MSLLLLLSGRMFEPVLSCAACNGCHDRREETLLTASSLREQTHKDLGQLAKKRGVQGWHSMRKDELVRALVRLARSKSTSSPRSRSKTNGASTATNKNSVRKGAAPAKATKRPTAAQRRIRHDHDQQERFKNLAHPLKGANGKEISKDRIILMVRDSYWLHVYWEITSNSVRRAEAALAEKWHAAEPVLRLLKVDVDSTESLERIVPIHGDVSNWYIDVNDAPKTYRVEIGYLAKDGKFVAVARSNRVTTPLPGSADAMDENWRDVVDNCDQIFSLSGGWEHEGAPSDLADLFQEQMRRPMGTPTETRFGAGAERVLNRARDFSFELQAEMIVYGRAKPGSYITLAGEPVKLRGDGSFMVKMALPDKRQVLPVVANSADGVEQRTIVLAIERNTKVMEPIIRDTTAP